MKKGEKAPPRTDEWRRKQSELMRFKWKAKRSEMLLTIQKTAKKNTDIGHYVRFGAALKKSNAAHPEWGEAAREKARKRLRGSNGFGRGARGNKNHQAAASLIIRGPTGVTFHAKNISEFCRQNEALFSPNNEGRFKTPLWKRASTAFCAQVKSKRKNEATSWRGWQSEKWEHTDYIHRQPLTPSP